MNKLFFSLALLSLTFFSCESHNPQPTLRRVHVNWHHNSDESDEEYVSEEKTYGSDEGSYESDERSNGETIDEETGSFIMGIISAKKTCECCGGKYSNGVGYSIDGRSPNSSSEYCTSGQTIFCSRSCYDECGE